MDEGKMTRIGGDFIGDGTVAWLGCHEMEKKQYKTKRAINNVVGIQGLVGGSRYTEDKREKKGDKTRNGNGREEKKDNTRDKG